MKLFILGILLMFFGFMYNRKSEHFSTASAQDMLNERTIDVDYIDDVDEKFYDTNREEIDTLVTDFNISKAFAIGLYRDPNKQEIIVLANDHKLPIGHARILFNSRAIITDEIISKIKTNIIFGDRCPWPSEPVSTSGSTTSSLPSDLEANEITARQKAQSNLNNFKKKNNKLKDDLFKIKILKDEKMRRALKKSELNAKVAIEDKIKRLKKYDEKKKSHIYTKCPIVEFPYNSFDNSQYLLEASRHNESKWNGFDDKVALVNKLPFNFVTH
jgi:hypothetical protein